MVTSLTIVGADPALPLLMVMFCDEGVVERGCDETMTYFCAPPREGVVGVLGTAPVGVGNLGVVGVPGCDVDPDDWINI